MSHSTQAGSPLRSDWRLAAALGAALLPAALTERSAAQCQYEVIAVIRGRECPPFDRAAAWGWGLTSDAKSVAGGHRCAIGLSQAFEWHGEGLPIDVPMPDGVPQSSARDIDDDGRIAGYLVSPEEGFGNLAFVHDGEGTRTLGVLPGHNWSEVAKIGPDGILVGFSKNNLTGPVLAVMWQDEEIVDLTPLLQWSRSRARDVNDRRQIIGERRDADGVERAYLLDLPTRTVTDVGFPPGAELGEARAINNLGQIVGYGVHPDTGVFEGFLWEDGAFTDLGLLPDRSRTVPEDVNDHGIVVGSSRVPALRVAFHWQDGELHDLNDLVPDAQGFYFRAARVITDDGVILTHAVENGMGNTRTVLLAPFDPPAGDATGDCRADMLDLLLVLSTWGECTLCIADLNGDEVIDANDLELVLASWS